MTSTAEGQDKAPRQGMTGFGRASGQAEWGHWAVEAKSVNGRGLDVRVNVPPGFDRLEAFIREQARARFHRGSLQVALRIDLAETSALSVNRAALDELMDVWRELTGREKGQPGGPAVASLLGVRGIVEASSGTGSLRDLVERDDVLEMLSGGIAQALDGLRTARQAEGASLHGLLSGLLDEMMMHLRAAAQASQAAPSDLKQKLETRIADLGGVSSLDPGRLEAEIVLAAAKADVREEIDRLAAHFQSAHELLGSEGAVGRKLDFLAQELMREANTLCSKSTSLALTNAGLGLKTLIDQFKEQAANVE